MEPSRTRTARDLAAAEARARPATQYASQYPAYPEQAQEFYPRRQRAAPQETPPVQPVRQLTAAAAAAPLAGPLQSVRDSAATSGAPRRLLGLLAFAVLTGLSLPVHIAALFFVYVQVESPGDIASAAPLLAGMFVAVFVAMTATGVITQLVGGFPGRWPARVTFAAISGVIGLAVAYAAALTQF